MGRVLGHQLAAVRAVHRLVAQPARQQPVPLEVGPGGRGHPGGELPDLGGRGVAVPALAPHLDAGQAVADQRRGVAAPHPHRGVVAPAVLGELERPQDLQRLDPLLAQARGVQDLGRAPEVRMGKERLHRSTLHGATRHGRGAGHRRGADGRHGRRRS